MTKAQKEYKAAEKQLINTKWRIKMCSQGSDCWCRIIVPVTKVSYSVEEDMYVIGSGSVSKGIAAHIVKVHNESLEK